MGAMTVPVDIVKVFVVVEAYGKTLSVWQVDGRRTLVSASLRV